MAIFLFKINCEVDGMTEETVQELDLHLLEQPEKRPVKDGLTWVREAWFLFKRRWGTWLLMTFVSVLISSFITGLLEGFLSAAMPQFKIIFNLLASALQTILFVLLMGGMLISAASLAEEDDLKLSYLFAGFQYQFKPLLLLSVVFLAVSAVLGVVIGLLGGADSLEKGETLWLLLLPLLLFGLLMWGMGAFSTVLVVLHDVAPLKAIGMSLKAFFRNWSAFLMLILVWLGIGVGIGFTAVIGTFLLSIIVGQLAGGLMVLLLTLPFILLMLALAILQMYTAYRNVWTNLPME